MSFFTTYQDAIDALIDYLGGNPAESVVRDCKRAVAGAYRDIGNAHRWSYLYTHGRIVTSTPFTGSDVGATVAYQEFGGTYDRQVTLSGSTWPDWAADGYIRFAGTDQNGQTVDVSNYGNVAYRVAERKSATIITLAETLAPTYDIPAGAEFQLYQDTYLLPADFIAQDQAMYERNFGGMDYTHPREWLYENRYVFAQGVPQCYTITGDPKYPGRMVIRIFPWPTDTKSIDFVYQRRPRPLATAKATGGTASITAGTAIVTTTQAVFTPRMVGAVVRLGSTAAVPTSDFGTNPAAFESVVTDWISATQVNVLDASDIDLAGVGYIISDPIDIEPGAMTNAFNRCCEMHLGINRTLKDKPSAQAQYQVALGKAKDADSRSFAGRAAGPATRIRPRLRDMPVGPDEP